MLKLEVGRILELHESLVIEKGHFERAWRGLDKQGNGNFSVEAHYFRNLRNVVAEVERIASAADLNSTRIAAGRTREFMSQLGELNGNAQVLFRAEGAGNVFRHLMDICSRIRDDCAGRFYFQIAPKNAELLTAATQHFGADVERAFAPAMEDIAEAASCLALERSTACAFHLMRALEIAATVVANKIGATVCDVHGRGLPWGVIANNMKPVIDKMPRGSDEQTRWYRAQSFLEVVNRAWRAPTAHPKQTYTPEEARNVFDATRAFMQELAPLA